MEAGELAGSGGARVAEKQDAPSRSGRSTPQFTSRSRRPPRPGLAIVVAIPVAVLFYFQFNRWTTSRTTSAVVLRQLSSDTADSLARAVEESLKRPHISVLLGIPQARTEPLDLPFIDPIFETASARARSSNRSGSGPRSARSGESLAGLRPREPAHSRAGRIGVPRRRGGRATRCWPVARAGRLSAGHRRLHRDHRRPPALRAGAAAVRGPVARSHDQRGGVCRRRREAAHAVHPGGAARLARDRCSSRPASRTSKPRCWTMTAARCSRRTRARGEHPPVDERSFPLIFFDKELLEFAAPYEQHREIWRLRTGYGPQTIPEIVSASTRPQMALMIVLALVMALRRVPRGRRRGPRGARRRAEVELRRLGLARPEDAARADSAVRRNARARPRAHARARAGVLPHHQRRSEEADAPDREHPRLLADGSRPAAVPHGAGRPAGIGHQGAVGGWAPVLAGQLRDRDHDRAEPAARPRRRRRRRAGDREPAGQRDEVLGRRADHRGRRPGATTATSWSASPITASASPRREQGRSSASSIACSASSAAVRRAAASAWRSSTTRCAATAASCASRASPITAARSRCTSPSRARTRSRERWHDSDA